MEPMYCAEETCPRHTVHTGGKFRLVAGKWYCETCWDNVSVPNSGKNLWDFVTPHFDGTPVHVRSRSHLDQLCKQHGVSNHARENYERNW